MERMEARRRVVRSFLMQGEIQVRTPTQELFGDHLIQGQYPNRLRAEILGPFGRPILTLVCDGLTLTALDYQENRAFRGPPSRANLERFLGLALSPEEIYALLIGCPPLLANAQGEMSQAPQDGQALLKLLGPGGVLIQGLVFGLPDFAVSRFWLRQAEPASGSSTGSTGSDVLMEGSFSEMSRSETGDYPLRVALEDGQGRQAELINQELKLNLKLDGSVFELALPPGFTVSGLP